MIKSPWGRGIGMSRTRNTTFEEMIEIASFLPWWIASILAVISYFVFHYFSLTTIPADGTEQVFIILSNLLKYLVPTILGFGALISAVRQWKRISIFNRQSSLETIRDLSWQSFELLISEAFRKKGYQVSETQDGPDGGIDLILKKEDRTIFVQCKHWKKFKVGVKEVRELKGVVAAKGIYSGILVTSGVFTTDAFEFADTSGIELIDGKDLQKLIPQIDKPQIEVQEEQSPLCPKCGDVMIKRTAKKGPNVGNQFWGCSTFPKCKGVINSIS